MDYFFNKIVNENDKSNPKGKKQIAHKLLNIIKDISDPIEQSYWLRKLSEEIEISEDALTEFLEQVKLKESKTNVKRKQVSEKENINPSNNGKSNIIKLQENLLGLVIVFSAQLKDEIEKFDIALLDEGYQNIWNKISSGKTKKIDDVVGRLEMQTKYIYNQDELKEKDINFKREWQEVSNKIKLFRKEKELADIIKDIKTAEEQDDEESLNMLMKEFSKISIQLEKLKK
jgi:DNA primase